MSADKILSIAALAIVAAASAFGLASTLALLHTHWTAWYGPSAHGYLVLAAAVWIAATAWQSDPPRKLNPNWWALLPLAGLLALLIGLEWLFVQSTRLLLLPPLVLAAVDCVFGREATKRLLWPTLLLYFALPQWWIINGPLQDLTTAAVTSAVRWTGVPAFVDGNLVQLPSGTFEIASGCSGLNYLQAATALAAFHGLLSLATWRSRLLLLTASAAVAVVFNWIRVYLVILVGHLSEMQHYLITGEHHTFGWILFLVAMVPVYVFATRLERNEAPSAAPAVPSHSRIGFPTASGLVLPAALATAAIVLLPMPATQPGAALEPTASTALPTSLGDNEVRTRITSGWSPVFLNAQEDSGAFVGESPTVEVYRAVYPHQDSERRLLRPANDFLGADFRLLEEAERRLSLADGTSLAVTEYRGTLRQRPRVVWSWYWVADTQVSGGLQAKLAEARSLLRGRRDGVAIALSVECVPDCQVAQARLGAFVALHERALRWVAAEQP